MALQPKDQVRPELVAKGIPLKEKRVQFFFDFDSYKLSDQSISDLTALVDFLKKEPDWQLEVIGSFNGEDITIGSNDRIAR